MDTITIAQRTQLVLALADRMIALERLLRTAVAERNLGDTQGYIDDLQNLKGLMAALLTTTVAEHYAEYINTLVAKATGTFQPLEVITSPQGILNAMDDTIEL